MSARPRTALAAAIGLGLATLTAWAAETGARTTLADPTRPPAWAGPGGPSGAPAVAAPARSASQALPRSVPAPAAPVLQAVLLPGDDSPASALIDGRLLRVGDALGPWTLAAIAPDAVLLQQASAGATAARRWRLPLLAALAPPADALPPGLPRAARAPTAAAGPKEP